MSEHKSFAANLNPEPEEPQVPVYEHGYSVMEVDKIEKAKAEILKRDLQVEPVTIEELKEVIIPWNRIHRTTVFNLNPEKPKAEKKERVPKEKKERVPREKKEKKLTKAEIKKRIESIIMKVAMGTATPEEEAFYNEHTTRI